MWYNILVSNGVSQVIASMISTFLNLYLCGVGLAVVVSLSHIKRKDLKGVKYRKGRAIQYNASTSNHLTSEERRT